MGKRKTKVKKSFFTRKASKELNKELNKAIEELNLTKDELDYEKLLTKKSDPIKARTTLAKKLTDNNFYGLTFLTDRALDKIVIFDHETNFEHHIQCEWSYELNAPDSLYTQLHDTGKYIEHLKETEEFEKNLKNYKRKSPNWIFTSDGFVINASDGVYLDYPEEAVDFIPIYCTPQEVIVSSEALVGLGDGDVNRGGLMMIMLNSIWARRGKKMIKELPRKS
tara:strand:- start:268 stop:936 length:669 start_codon:yes stop_codon:yes gene_type:complete